MIVESGLHIQLHTCEWSSFLSLFSFCLVEEKKRRQEFASKHGLSEEVKEGKSGKQV